MNENKTASILQRAPVILAVTAASYGLPSRGQAPRAAGDAGATRHATAGAAAASVIKRMREDLALQN